LADSARNYWSKLWGLKRERSLSYPLNPRPANQNAWIKSFRDELKKYKDIEIVDEVYGYDNEQKAFDATVALTTKYPDLTGIFAPTCPVYLQSHGLSSPCTRQARSRSPAIVSEYHQ